MFRVASIILIIVLAISAGCRSSPATRVGQHRGTIGLDGVRAPDREQPLAEIRAASFVAAAGVIDRPDNETPRPELLPSPNPPAGRRSPLALTDFEEIAFHNNPTLAIALARVDAARGRRTQAGLIPNPVVGYHATEIGNLGTAGQQGGFITQRLITGRKLRLDQAIAGKEIDEARLHLLAQEMRVLNDVRLRFYEVLVAQRRLELNMELGRLGDEFVKAAETRLKGRIGTENALLQAEIQADEAQLLLSNVRNENVEAWRRLTTVIGLPGMQMTALRGELDVDLPTLDWDDCQARVLGHNLELDAALARVDRASIAMDRASRERIPDVDLSLSVRHHNVTRSDVANVQVGMPIPIFNRNQGDIRRAEAEWLAANNEVRRIELDLRDRLAVVYRRYANARHQADRYRQRMMPKAKKSLDLVARGYEAKRVEYVTLLTAQQTYLQVNLRYLEALRQVWTTSAVIDGQLLTESLSHGN